jgi:hypothetical protein
VRPLGIEKLLGFPWGHALFLDEVSHHDGCAAATPGLAMDVDRSARVDHLNRVLGTLFGSWTRSGNVPRNSLKPEAGKITPPAANHSNDHACGGSDKVDSPPGCDA